MSGISGSSMCMSDGTFAPVAKLTNSLPSCISICFSLLVAPSTGCQKCFFVMVICWKSFIWILHLVCGLKGSI